MSTINVLVSLLILLSLLPLSSSATSRSPTSMLPASHSAPPPEPPSRTLKEFPITDADSAPRKVQRGSNAPPFNDAAFEQTANQKSSNRILSKFLNIIAIGGACILLGVVAVGCVYLLYKLGRCLKKQGNSSGTGTGDRQNSVPMCLAANSRPASLATSNRQQFTIKYEGIPSRS